MARQISDEGEHAARAVAQWLLGDPDWASKFFSIASTDNPKETAKVYIEDDAFEDVWRESRNR